MVDLSARLEAAALSLTGPGPIKDRLFDAYCQHLEDIHESDLPGPWSAEFAQMIRAFHQARALPGDDIVRASVRKLSNDEACQYAKLVVRLYGIFAGVKQPLVSVRNVRPMMPLANFLAAEASGAP